MGLSSSTPGHDEPSTLTVFARAAAQLLQSGVVQEQLQKVQLERLIVQDLPKCEVNADIVKTCKNNICFLNK